MAIAFYILGFIAVGLLIIAVPLVTIRALILMARLETTRADLAKFIVNADLSLHHGNRVLARSQESAERLSAALEHIEHLLTVLQPATALSGLFSGVKRAMSGQRQPDIQPAKSPEGGKG